MEGICTIFSLPRPLPLIFCYLCPRALARFPLTWKETEKTATQASLKWKTLFYDRQVFDLFVNVSSYRIWNRWKYFRPVNNQENPVASNHSELFIGKSSGCRCYKSPVLWFLPHPNDLQKRNWKRTPRQYRKVLRVLLLYRWSIEVHVVLEGQRKIH